jgi:putative ABC transport system ATP-binding protein
MDQSLFRFIWANSRKQQIATILLTLFSLPILYLSLELPKQIINEAIGGESWPRIIAGQSIEQEPALLCLCIAFILLVVLTAYLRHRVNLRRSRISVDLLSRLRRTLMARVMQFPLAQFKRTAPGDIANMVIYETSSFGRFFGDLIAVPVFEGLKFTSILVFVFIQDFYLGLAAIALLPGQVALMLRLQRRVNRLTEEIVVRERSLSSRITEVVDGVQNVHAQDDSARFLEGIRRRLARLAACRMEASSRASPS